MGVIVGLKWVHKAGPTFTGDSLHHSIHSFTTLSTSCVSGTVQCTFIAIVMIMVNLLSVKE